MQNQQFDNGAGMNRAANGGMQTGGYAGQADVTRNPYIDPGVPAADAAPQNPYYGANDPLAQAPAATAASLFGSFDTSNFLKGALIGALGAYLLTNEKAQKALFKGVAKGTQLFQAGMEEMKERFEDAKAELAADE